MFVGVFTSLTPSPPPRAVILEQYRLHPEQTAGRSSISDVRGDGHDGSLRYGEGVRCDLHRYLGVLLLPRAR